MTAAFSPPDFIVVGGYTPEGKVYLFASKTLKYAELREEAENLDFLEFERRMISQPRYRFYINSEVHDYIVVLGDSYPQAWSTLFASWSPESSRVRREEIEGRLGLDQSRNLGEA